jgi:hypothetical protein
VPGPCTVPQHVSVNALSIVANPQAKVALAVDNFDFDLARARVMESVSQCLASDPVNLVLKDGRQGPTPPIYSHAEHRLSSI